MRSPPRIYVGVTDLGWFDFLSARPGLDEVNFWRPGGSGARLAPGTLFLFKLKSPRNVIGGGGIFVHAERMTVGTAWEFYGERNGAQSANALLALIARNRPTPIGLDHPIGCDILSTPFFLEADEWLSLPADWPRSGIQQGKYYDLGTVAGDYLWQQILARTAARNPAFSAGPGIFGGHGTPLMVVPRLGQGTFRKLVLAAYDNRCALTGEKTIPVLQASHIKPFAETHGHEIQNGISLRSDIHTLFDRGYVTITPDHRFRVSTKLREDFSNGRVYYEHDGRTIQLPSEPQLRPRPEFLEWHADEVFKG
ncbi:MAG: HNH endonuclease [Candidatus Eremiobacteraeota bacterium]|nr:HNH endonuclease [Candidatus Eremiobacteraeota bacterium]